MQHSQGVRSDAGTQKRLTRWFDTAHASVNNSMVKLPYLVLASPISRVDILHLCTRLPRLFTLCVRPELQLIQTSSPLPAPASVQGSPDTKTSLPCPANFGSQPPELVSPYPALLSLPASHLDGRYEFVGPETAQQQQPGQTLQPVPAGRVPGLVRR